MGAETTYWVKVGKLRYEWVEVSAVTAAEAYAMAFNLPGVASVVEATHEEPHDDIRREPMNDPKNWNAVEWGSFDVGSPVFAKEIEKRWNAYPGLVAAMRKIAKPALGGKQQQYMAQAILRELGEHDGDSRE